MFSYHIWTSDEIKCYLLWNGQCHRFFGQDIVQILPEIFVKNKENKIFAASDEAKRLSNQMNKLIPDKDFEKFHRVVNNMKKGEFPMNYDVPEPSHPETQ